MNISWVSRVWKYLSLDWMSCWISFGVVMGLFIFSLRPTKKTFPQSLPWSVEREVSQKFLQRDLTKFPVGETWQIRSMRLIDRRIESKYVSVLLRTIRRACPLFLRLANSSSLKGRLCSQCINLTVAFYLPVVPHSSLLICFAWPLYFQRQFSLPLSLL